MRTGLTARLVLVAAVLGCASPPPAPPPSLPGALPLDQLVGRLAAELADVMAAEEPQGFVAYPMEGDAAGSALGALFADRLTDALARRGPQLRSVVGSVERDLLMAELRSQLGEMYAEEGVPRLGELVGFRWMVTSKMVSRPGGAEILARATDLESGTFAQAHGVLLADDVVDLLAPARRASSDRFTAEIGWTVDAPAASATELADFWSLRVRNDAHVRFWLRADRDVHALVFTRGTSGKGLLLLPHDERPDAPLAAGERLSLPPDGLDPFAFRGQPGTEVFYVVFSPRPPRRHPVLSELLDLPRLSQRDGRLDIRSEHFVPARRTAELTRELDALIDSSRRWRSVLDYVDRLGAGEDAGAIRFRDLGNADVAPARREQRGGRTSVSRSATLQSNDLVVVRFRVPHEP